MSIKSITTSIPISEAMDLIKDMRSLDLDINKFDRINSATKILVNAMKHLNNPETESKVIVEIFEDFKAKMCKHNKKWLDQAPDLVLTIAYWNDMYSKLLLVTSNEEVKNTVKSLFDSTQNIHNQSKYNLGQSFMKATMHLMWKKLATFNPDIATADEMSDFEEDTPKDIVIGQIAFKKIFADEIEV